MALDLAKLDTAPRSAPARATAPLLTRGAAPGRRDRMIFTDRLALMLEAGVPLHGALESLTSQSENPAMGAVVRDLATQVAEGRPFSEALARHPRLFSPTYVHLVGSGEQGGFLHQVLQRILTFDEKQERMRSSVASALSYPAFLMLFSVAVVVFVLVAVFPKFAELFASIHDRLPITTRFFMAVSDALRFHWFIILPAVAGAAFVLWRWSRTEAGRALLDHAKLAVPLLRPLYVQVYMAQTLRVLGLSLGNGVNVLDALHASRDLVSNTVFRRFMAELEVHVTEGRGLARGFRDAPFVPPMVRQMIATGEATGSLALVLERLADFYDRELVKRITTLTKLMEPLMLVFMGLVVGLVVSSLILPIFKLSSAAH